MDDRSAQRDRGTVSFGEHDYDRVRTLESQPSETPRRTTRSIARAPKLSRTAMARIWRAFGLQPTAGRPSS